MVYTTEMADWKTAGASSDVKSIIWFVVKDDDQVLGRAGLRVKKNEIHFYRAIIDPEHRGKGLYSLLIDARLDYARSLNITTVFCLCNELALPRLVHKGFVEVGPEGKFTLVKIDLSTSSDSPMH